MDSELPTYYPIIIFLGVLLLFAVVSLALAHLVGPRRRNPVKQMPYESGMDPVGDARQKFDIKYYLVAIMFLVFDIELLFLYPWAVSAYQSEGGIPTEFSTPVFIVMLIFMATLGIAYIYAWKKGIFQWR